MSERNNGVLNNLRVLDVSQARGLYAGKLLADLGADVVKVEKPGGDEARRTGPFKGDIPGPETSLYFSNFNAGKKSITLNLQSPIGCGLFTKLGQKADVILEDFRPGTMETLGLSYSVLSEINKRLIMTSVTGFGESGPYSGFNAPDLVTFAMGGLMSVAGDPGRPPVVAPCEQSYHAASVMACYGTLAALYQRLCTGTGQWVKISAQEALAVQEHLILRYDLESDIVLRRGSQHTTAPTRIYRCKDGFVYLFVSVNRHWRSLLELMGNPEALTGEAWDDVRFRRLNVDVIDPIVTEFTMQHTRTELTAKCQARHIPCTPVNTPGEFIEDRHTRARGFTVETEHPVMGKYRSLGPAFKLNGMDHSAGRRAPLLGEHNEEIFCRELGCTREELDRLRSQGVI